MAQKEIKDWITVNHQHIPIFEGQSKQDAINKAIKHQKSVNDDEDKKQKQIAENKRQADEKNEKESGKVINGKFYTLKELKDMSLEEMRKIMGGQLSTNRESKSLTTQSKKYSFSENAKLSDTEKDWLEQAVDWSIGDDNMPMVGMNTISNYYNVKFGKSASVIKEIKSDGEIVFKSMDKKLINQAMDNVEKLKKAIREKEKK